MAVAISNSAEVGSGQRIFLKNLSPVRGAYLVLTLPTEVRETLRTHASANERH